MTETDATRTPLEMPEKFLPYLEKHRIYKLFKDAVRELIVELPKDHLKHMKMFFGRHMHCSKDADKIMMLISPELKLDVKGIAKQMIKDLGLFVITRQCVMDRYEKFVYVRDGSFGPLHNGPAVLEINKRSLCPAVDSYMLKRKKMRIRMRLLYMKMHDDYVEGCISPVLMSEVTKTMTLREPVPQAGWLMFDHPCSLREARVLQQDGVLPTVTLVLMPTPPVAPTAPNPLTPSRNFFQQDFEGLKYAYKATLKEVHIEPGDDVDKISLKCFNAINASSAGQQGPKHGYHVLGAPSVYRVLLLGARGSGRRSQAQAVAKNFGLVYFKRLTATCLMLSDEAAYGVTRLPRRNRFNCAWSRMIFKDEDCIDYGWVLTGFPTCGAEFEALDTMTTPPNRIIFLNVDMATCKSRLLSLGVDWCTGQRAPLNSGPRVLPQPEMNVKQLDKELEYYFSEALAELRAAAGLAAVEVNAQDPFDKVQVKIQAAIMAAPAFDIEISSSQLRYARGD